MGCLVANLMEKPEQTGKLKIQRRVVVPEFFVNALDNFCCQQWPEEKTKWLMAELSSIVLKERRRIEDFQRQGFKRCIKRLEVTGPNARIIAANDPERVEEMETYLDESFEVPLTAPVQLPEKHNLTTKEMGIILDAGLITR
jgi:hypothetical protein